MTYPRVIKFEEPFEYAGYLIKVAIYEATATKWGGTYHIFEGDERVLESSVSGDFDTREEAYESVTSIAKFRADEMGPV